MVSYRRSLWLGGLALVGAGAAHAFLIRPWHLRWGATDAELHLKLPGDDLIPNPRLNSTHAISMDEPPSAVWSWLVQMGQGRVGFYSYDWIDNLLSFDIHTANRIHPEHQHLNVGEVIPLASSGFALPVAIVEPCKALVLHGNIRVD